MSIYNRNKEGILKPVNITVVKGEKGKDGKDGITPNIKIGEVKTIPAGKEAKVRRRGNKENPIYDFNIPKGVNGEGASCDLDDNVISEVDGWSSDKITKWSIEQDGVIWVEKEGDFISVDNTYEYKLKEIEIFGDTWQQDKASNNLFNINSEYIDNSYIDIDGEIKSSRGHRAYTEYIEIEPEVEYRLDNYPPGNGTYLGLFFYNESKTFISGKRLNSGGIVLKAPADAKYCRVSAFYIKDKQNIMLSKSNITSYEPYYKVDLSNIQHVGELYVDEKGEAKLDDQGRKQYKIEIESCTENLFNNQESSLIRVNGDIVTITIPEYKKNEGAIYCIVYSYDDNRTNINHYLIGDNYKRKYISLAKNEKFIQVFPILSRCTIEVTLGPRNGNVVLEYQPNLIPIDPHQSHKQTIILPCQLSRVGNVKDRLFWDESKGKYIVEKNITELSTSSITVFMNQAISDTHVCCYGVVIQISNIDANKGYVSINNKFDSKNNPTLNSIYNAKVSGIAFGNAVMYVCVEKSNLDTPDYDGLRKWWRDNKDSITIYACLKTPQLIETNITEPLYLPTYNNKTHVYHINDNNAKATIKAKFPLKTSNTLSSLSLQNSTISNEIISIQESNTDLIANNFENDFRVSELEWNLTDAGLYSSSENKKIISNSLSLTRFEQAKILILSNKYDKEKMTYQLTKYLERGYLDQEEFNILIELMENE